MLKLSSKSIDEAIILAGGLGTRLDPLTKNRPKPLVPIGNLPMLDWNFLVLASNGIKRAVVVVGYLGDQIREHIRKFTSKMCPDMSIDVPDVQSKGTADALRVVSNHIDADNFFVTMSDIVTNIDLKEMANFHLKKGGLATISIKPLIKFPKQFGVILVDDQQRITRFLEKPNTGNELYYSQMINSRRQNFQTNLINSGFYCFKSDILRILEKSNSLIDFGKDVFPYLIKEKQKIFGYKSEKDYYWQDCGCPNQVLDTNLDILQQGNSPYLPIGKQQNGSWFGTNSKFKNVIIKKPVAIGNNVNIRFGTKIHLSSINDQSSIGRKCTIIGSSIWENVKIGDNVRIINSIISDNVIIGDNCIIEDETIIPAGLKIASNSYIRKGKLVQFMMKKPIEKPYL